MSHIIEDYDTFTHLQQGHTEPITDQDDKCCSEHATLLQSSTTIDVHSIVDIPEDAASAIPSENTIPINHNGKETDKKEQPSKSMKIAKLSKKLLPHICILLVVLVIFGPVCYIVSNRNGSSQFVNLKVNFDLCNFETTSGKIPWRPIDATFVVLEGNCTNISVLQSGSYSIDVTLNLDNRRNKESVTVSVCILNSRNGDRCIPEVLPAHMQRSVTASVNLDLQKGDTIWVNVKGLNLIYQRPDVNSISIRKYDT